MAKTTKGKATKAVEGEVVDPSLMAPALSPEARENQLIYLAMELAEKQIREGTASSQIITHFLELGSSKEKTKQVLIQAQADLAKAKVTAIDNAANIESLYKDAIAAMKEYTGESNE